MKKRCSAASAEVFPFDIDYLPEFTAKKCQVELHETPDALVQGLKEIKELIEKDKYLSQVRIEEYFIEQYLRVQKFNVQKAFKCLKSCAHFRKSNPELFIDLDYEKTVRCMTDEIITFLPYRCQDGCAIILCELDNWYPATFSLLEVKKMLLIYFLGASQNLMTQINGVKVILDVKISSFRHLKYCTPQNLYLLYYGTQECVATRYKEIHIVNNSVVFRAAFMVIKPFLSQKISERFIFHESHETLLNYFPEASLPEKYGGKLKVYSVCDWLKRIMGPTNLMKVFNENIVPAYSSSKQ